MSDKRATQFGFYQGGLFRCCIMSLENTILEDEPKEGDIIKCMYKYCTNSMIYQGDGWKWNRDDMLEIGIEENVPC